MTTNGRTRLDRAERNEQAFKGVISGHEDPEVEVVVERRERYFIVSNPDPARRDR